jgi:large subunit ribosomal protein L16
MALMPKRTKYRKTQKGHTTGLSKAGNFVHFGDFGIQALERGWITSQQIEACRVTINRFFQRKGKVWIRIFPHKPVSKKPAEVRMGKGKGAVDHWVAVVRPGRIMFEVGGNVTPVEAQTAMRLAAAKLGIRTRFVTRLQHV